MKMRIDVMEAVLIAFVMGCRPHSSWVEETARSASKTLACWLSCLGDPKRGMRYSFDQEYFVDSVSSAIHSSMEGCDCSNAKRFPLGARIICSPLSKRDRQILKGILRDKRSNETEYKYELNVLMFCHCYAWQNDRLYLVEDCGENVNVNVVEIGMLNEWHYAGGQWALNETIDNLGVYCLCVGNILNDVLRDSIKDGLSARLNAIQEGAAYICWDNGPRPLPIGAHIYGREDFSKWMSRHRDVHVLELVQATDHEYVFVAAEFASLVRECARPHDGSK